jgi:hypothetical protein
MLILLGNNISTIMYLSTNPPVNHLRIFSSVLEPQFCNHFTKLTCFKNALLQSRKAWEGGRGIFLHFARLLLVSADTYQQLNSGQPSLRYDTFSFLRTPHRPCCIVTLYTEMQVVGAPAHTRYSPTTTRGALSSACQS